MLLFSRGQVPDKSKVCRVQKAMLVAFRKLMAVLIVKELLGMWRVTPQGLIVTNQSLNKHTIRYPRPIV